MNNNIAKKIRRFVKRCFAAFLVISHIALTAPLPEAYAMQSVNFIVDVSALSSGAGKNVSLAAEIPYSNIAGEAAGIVESANYKASLGYINSISSNPPVLRSLIPDANMRIVWDKGQTCSATIPLDSHFTSPDNSALTYEVEGAFGITATIDPVSHVASFSQDTEFYGSRAVRFVAIDANRNRTNSNFVILAVKAPSGNPPIISPLSDINLFENEPVHVSPTIFDPDGDTLTMTYSSPLDDSGNWQTTYNDAGTYKVTATVSDGTLQASTTFGITVKNVNRHPDISEIADIIADEGDMIKLNIVARDPDGNNVTVSYPSPFDKDGSWQTTHKDAGVYQFTVRASDGDLIATKDFNVTVNAINAPPILRVYANKTTVLPNENFTIFVLAQDPNGDTLKLTLKKDGAAIPSCENIVLEGQTYTKTMSITSIGSYNIDVAVEETGVLGDPNTATESLKIMVDDNSPDDVYFPISGDFNGDGLTDAGTYNRSDGTWKVQLALKDGTLGPAEYWITEDKDFGKDSQWFYPITGDWNGDGKTDVGFVRVSTSIDTTAYIRIALSSGKGFDVQDGNWRASADGKLETIWRFATVSGDFNGDGVTDIGQVDIDNVDSFSMGLTLDGLQTAAMRPWAESCGLIMTGITPMAADFNGDGLADIGCFKKESGGYIVAISRGDDIKAAAQWINDFGAEKDPVMGDFNCDGLTDVGYMDKDGGQWSIKYALSDGKKFNLNAGNAYVYRTFISDTVEGSFMTGDFNGDGLFDVAVFDKNDHEWTIKLHHSKFPDLLVGIDNGMGGKTDITYKDSVVYENNGSDGMPALPFSMRVVSSVTQSDGLSSAYTASYFYRDGYFDAGVREFRGFGYVKVIDAEGSYKETYFNQDNIYKGRPSKEVVRDRYDRVYSETSYNWQDRKFFNDKVDFPYLLDKTAVAYDPATGTTKSVKSTLAYDDYGNATNVRDEGFLDAAGDERESSVTYYYDTARWILSKPLESRMKDAAGNIVAATRYEYYPEGSLKKEERWLGQAGEGPGWGGAGNPTAEFTYDAAGNVETVTDARGNITVTMYDPTKTFPTEVRNALGHTQTFTYDKATGKMLTSTDPNGQTTASEYDGFGRQVRVTGPGGISETTYAYDLTVSPSRITSTIKVADGVYSKAYSFIDGLGRQILSRVEAEYKGTAMHIVSGEARYDSRGQVTRKYLPYYIAVPSPEDAYMPPQNTTPYVSYEYDAMGRLIKTIRPDNKVSYSVYGVNTAEAVNENGQHARQTKDAYGRIVEVEEETGDLTNYQYDTLGNLTDTYDSATPRNRVHMEYDTLGRKVSMTDPDMGGFAGKSWKYYYDKTGNLTSQTDAKGQIIEFVYDPINRLTSKKCRGGLNLPYISEVMYAYDDPAKPNCVGRLSRVEDTSGSTEFFYDILGRETKTVKHLVGVTGQCDNSYELYAVERTYDSLDRLTTVKYPDNSVVGYSYNKQGGISSLRGGTGGADEAIYVSSVNYNANGQMERIVYGNGTSTDYVYDPYNFRMKELSTVGPQLSTIQNLIYNFDPVGNVTSILDSVHTNTQHFLYDNLDRLVQANGVSYGQIDYEFNSIGNLLKKGPMTMEYGQAAGPHAVTKVTHLGGGTSSSNPSSEVVSVSYDYNGNMTAKGANTFEYDVENRLQKVMSEKGGGTFNISVDLNEGWNFFSLPGYIPNTGGSIAQILSSITGKYEQVSTYDTAADKWLHYVGDARFDQFDKFEYGRGYLIYCNEGCSISLSGNYPLNGVQYSLKEGWNLVAAPTDSQIETSLALRGVTYDSVAGYNGADYAYGPAALEKGKAYWVHVANSQTWSVPLPRIETVYSYDGDGGRVMRKIGTVPQGGVSSGGDCPNFSTHYIGSSYEVEGDKTTKHIFMGSTRVCSIEDLVGVTGQSNHSYEVYYYHQDHIGSSNVITDGTGAIVQILEYSPFGEVSRSTGNYSTDKRFTGKIYDDSSALLYFGARYYDPELGRFITADPTIAHPFDPQDLNRYSYCRNNPVNYIDPTGLSWWSSFWNWLTSGVGAIIASIAIIAVTAVAAIFTGGALAPVLWGEISGAIAGAAGAAATGGDIGRGMLIGTIVGGITGGVMGQMSAAAGAEGGASGGAAAGGTTAGLIIPADIALSMGTSMASTSAAVAVSNAGISAWGSVLASGVVGGGAAVINGMVSNAYAAGSKVGNHVTGEGPRLSIGFSGIRVAGKYTYVTHAGLQITGTDDYNISAGFNPENSNDISMFLGKPVNGVVRPNERYAFTLTVSKDPVFIQRVFNNIMKSSQNPPKYDFHALNDGKHYECYDWVADMLGS